MSEQQEFIFTCADETELERLKHKAMKLKVIVLDTWDKHPLQNPSLFNKRQKERFTNEIKVLWNTMSDEQIEKEFNDICCERLFNAGADVSTYPVYEPVGTANHSVLYKPDEAVVDTN